MYPKVIALVSAVVGILTFYHLNTSLSAYMDPRKHVCFKPSSEGHAEAKPPHFQVGIHFLDGLHCLLTPFFVDTVKVPTGRLATAETLAAVFGALGIAAVESIRSSARGFVWSWASTLLLGQLIGIGAAYPLFWLPSFFLTVRPKVPTATTPTNKVHGIWVTMMLLLLPLAIVMLQLDKMPVNVQNTALFIFQWGLPFSAVLWNLVPRDSKPHTDACKAVQLLLTTLLGVCIAVHYAAVMDWIVSGGSFTEIRGVALRLEVRLMPAHFLMVDASVMSLSCLLFVLGDGGLGDAAAFVLQSLVIGPGAAVLCYGLKREQRLTNAGRGGDAEAGAKSLKSE